jgi:hypothetical protein
MARHEKLPNHIIAPEILRILMQSHHIYTPNVCCIGLLTTILSLALPVTVCSQVHTFYEAVGLMIGAENDLAKREEYLARLMAPPNSTWQQIIAQVSSWASKVKLKL